jgi:hypothetical protein
LLVRKRTPIRRERSIGIDRLKLHEPERTDFHGRSDGKVCGNDGRDQRITIRNEAFEQRNGKGAELVADAKGHNVRQTVFIECGSMYRADGPEEFRVVGETEFVQGIAAESASGRYGDLRAAAGIVGAADLRLGDRVAPVLEAQIAASPQRLRRPDRHFTAGHVRQGAEVWLPYRRKSGGEFLWSDRRWRGVPSSRANVE